MKKKFKLPRVKAADLPATRGMLKGVRDEFLAKMSQLEKTMCGNFKEVDGKFKKVDGKFKKVDARFDKVDARFDKVDARFDKIDARFDGLEAMVARMGVLAEEQRADNRIVLEGLQVLWERQDRLDGGALV